jgi:PAS domain S-box-containing protein
VIIEFVPSDLRALSKVTTPMWIFDVARQQMRWANSGALRYWQAADLEALVARDFASDMSVSTKQRLAGYLDRFRYGDHVDETWTFYPGGEAVTLRCRCSGAQLDDQLMMLVEAREADVDVVNLRGVEALRHTTTQITLASPAGAVLMQNPAAAAAYPSPEPADVFARLCDDVEAEALAASLRAGEVYSGEVQVCTQGGVRWHALEARNTNDPGGSGAAVLINEQDITRIKETEAELRRAQEELEQRVQERTAELSRAVASIERGRSFLDAVLDTVPAMVFVADKQGTIVRVNRAGQSLSGRAERDVIGSPLSLLMPAAEGLLTNATRSLHEAVLITAAGEQRLLAISAAELPREADGAAELVVVSGVDITQQRDLQQRLQMTDRLVTLGSLAGGVAHDINNPLAVARANLELLDRQLAADAPAVPECGPCQQLIHDALEGVQRVASITEELDSFQRTMGDRIGDVDVQAVIRSAAKLADNEIRHRAQLTLELSAVPTVLSSPSRLGQVFLELLLNAAQALPEGAAGQHSIGVRCFTADDGSAVVEVEDSGAGIPEEQRARIFEPFFTTKRAIGSGLGLPTSKRIVEEAGGTLTLCGEADRGACFRVTLPPSASARIGAVDQTSPRGPIKPRDGRGRVLIIDDEPAVGRALRRILSLSHDVVVSESGREGLARLAEQPFDVVLCDLMMPELSGVEVFRQIERDHPALAAKVVFVTGGAFTEQSRVFLDDIANPRLPKPFELDEVQAVVARLLES